MYQSIKAFTYGRLHHRAEARATKAAVKRALGEAHMYAIVYEALMHDA